MAHTDLNRIKKLLRNNPKYNYIINKRDIIKIQQYKVCIQSKHTIKNNKKSSNKYNYLEKIYTDI